jgi:hypothetical protein
MADGSTKPIKDVKNGDKVVATDPETGETTTETVIAEIRGHGLKRLVKVTIDLDGDKGTKTASVTATDGHPFWVEDLKQWVKATNLQSGGWLRTNAGTDVQITEVKRWTSQSATVHNLTVSSLHTYYVLAGATPVLVHNCNVALGWQNNGDLDKWAKKEGFRTLSIARAQDFAQMAEKEIADPNVTLHINMTGLENHGDFMAAAQRGLLAGEAGPATDYEMSMIARSLAHGQRPWDTVKFYSPSGPGGAMKMHAPTAMPDLSVLRGEDMSKALKGSVIGSCHC